VEQKKSSRNIEEEDITVSSSHESYKVGDVAELTITSPFAPFDGKSNLTFVSTLNKVLLLQEVTIRSSKPSLFTVTKKYQVNFYCVTPIYL
jgi:uncharacterized protein YfaS (alpha-2-macroglobulin family)